MTVADLRAKIQSALALGDILKRFIPGEIDDRALEYVAAIAESDAILSLVVDDFFGGQVGPFGATAEVTVAAADGPPQAIDPATIALIIQLVTTFGPVIREWIKKRRER